MKVAFKMKLKPGFSEEYKKRHDAIWPELVVLLRESGIYDYTIFFDEETNLLFAVQMVTGQNSQDLGQQEILQQWWAFMADIMETNPDHSPVTIPLVPLFHLD